MAPESGRFQLQIMGGFRLATAAGDPVRIVSRKGMALIAMLATGRNGARSRIWLQDRLWSSRGATQAQASLRRELANLRHQLSAAGQPDLITADHAAVTLALGRVQVDLHEDRAQSRAWGDLLEGIDIGEEGFEEWLREQRTRIAAEMRSAPASGPADRLRGRPTIAVTPVEERLSPGEEIVLDGVVDTLTDRLARLRWMAVIAPRYVATPFRPEGASADTLGIDYLLQCRFVAAADGRELHLSLSQATSARLIWSRRYPFPSVIDPPALARIAEEAVAVLAGRLEVEQQTRALDRGTAALRPNELVWRARWHMRRLTREDAAIAADLLDEAARASPHDVDIQIEQVFHQAWRVWSSRGGVAEKQALRAAAMRVRDRDPFDARAYYLCGVAEFWLGGHAEAAAMLTIAIDLNPSMASAYGQLASCHSMAGNPTAALPLLETALRLDPFGTENFHQYGEIALANFMLGRQEQAVFAANEALARRPAYFYAHAIRIAAFGELDAPEEQAAARHALASVKPRLDADMFEWLPFKDRRWVSRLQTALNPEDLRLAG